MKFGLRVFAVLGGLLIGGLILPATANAWYSHTEASASMRAGPGVKYKRIATIPAGSRLWVDWCKANWCYATWKNKKGYIAASLIARSARGPVYDNYYDYSVYGDYWWLYYHDWPRPPYCKKGHHCWPKPPHCKKGDCPKPPKPPKWDGPKGPKHPKFDSQKWNAPKGPKWDGPKLQMNDGAYRPDRQMNVAPSMEMRGSSGDREGGGDRGGRGFDRDRWRD